MEHMGSTTMGQQLSPQQEILLIVVTVLNHFLGAITSRPLPHLAPTTASGMHADCRRVHEGSCSLGCSNSEKNGWGLQAWMKAFMIDHEKP